MYISVCVYIYFSCKHLINVLDTMFKLASFMDNKSTIGWMHQDTSSLCECCDLGADESYCL